MSTKYFVRRVACRLPGGLSKSRSADFAGVHPQTTRARRASAKSVRRERPSAVSPSTPCATSPPAGCRASAHRRPLASGGSLRGRQHRTGGGSRGSCPRSVRRPGPSRATIVCAPRRCARAGKAPHLQTPLSLEDLVPAINNELPADVNVLAAVRVPHRFHARHDAVARSHLYQIARRRTAFAKPYVETPRPRDRSRLGVVSRARVLSRRSPRLPARPAAVHAAAAPFVFQTRLDAVSCSS